MGWSASLAWPRSIPRLGREYESPARRSPVHNGAQGRQGDVLPMFRVRLGSGIAERNSEKLPTAAGSGLASRAGRVSRSAPPPAHPNRTELAVRRRQVRPPSYIDIAWPAAALAGWRQCLAGHELSSMGRSVSWRGKLGSALVVARCLEGSGEACVSRSQVRQRSRQALER